MTDTFTNDRTGEKWEFVVDYKPMSPDEIVIRKIKPKIFEWDKVNIDVVICSTENELHWLKEKGDYSKDNCGLRLSDKWQVWMGGEQPLPDYVKVEVCWRDDKKVTDQASNLYWEHNSAISDIIAFRVLNIGDHKYPDEL